MQGTGLWKVMKLQERQNFLLLMNFQDIWDEQPGMQSCWEYSCFPQPSGTDDFRWAAVMYVLIFVFKFIPLVYDWESSILNDKNRHSRSGAEMSPGTFVNFQNIIYQQYFDICM